MLTPKVKLRLVLSGIAIAVLLNVVNPFLISFRLGSFSKEAIQAVLAVLEFLAVAYLWRQFNVLRVTINKKELEDGDLLELEKSVQQITHTKP